jgi:hypothetical protein
LGQVNTGSSQISINSKYTGAKSGLNTSEIHRAHRFCVVLESMNSDEYSDIKAGIGINKHGQKSHAASKVCR